jgi:hypothetical protein
MHSIPSAGIIGLDLIARKMIPVTFFVGLLYEHGLFCLFRGLGVSGKLIYSNNPAASLFAFRADQYG